MLAFVMKTREGAEIPATALRTVDGVTGQYRERGCSRCGGQGWSSKWSHTGLTCFDCGGNGKHKSGPVFERAYTDEQLAKLNARRDATRARAKAKRDAAEAAKLAEAEQRLAFFMAENNGWLAEARRYADQIPFVADIIERAQKYAMVTPAQIEAVRNAVAREQEKEARIRDGKWLGAEGERISFEGEVVFFDVRESRDFRFGPSYFTIIKCAEGTVMYRGARSFGARGTIVKMAATVKELGRSKAGEKVTHVQRPGKIEYVKLVRFDDAD